MRIKLLPEDFQVEELVRLRARQSGPYTLYRVHKQAVTTLDVQARMAHALGRPPAAVSLPALKDKTARVTQYATVHGDGPARVEGRGFVAERAGWVDRPLAPSDLLGNRFTIVVRDLGAEAARAICGQMERVTQEGLPNYFDQQRFGSQTERGDFPGRRIILRDAEGALHAHLAEHLAGDIHRVYAKLTQEWLMYCKHPQKAYPYIFSIIARTHPLQEHPDATVH